MVNKKMMWLVILLSVVLLLWVAIAFSPKGEPGVGMTSGLLSQCPDSPNCVCSEDESHPAYIAPFAFDESPDKAWEKISQVVKRSGGVIQQRDDNYLWATFTSTWLRFVDDVELRLDAEKGLIHVRSASRFGYSDFSVNRKRVEALRALFYPGKG